jgi:hypothetical protein
MENYVLGEFSGFTLNCEENFGGGILIWAFLGFCSWVHVGSLRRGGNVVRFEVELGWFLGVYSPVSDWGDLRGGLFTKKNCQGRGVSLQYNGWGEGFTLRKTCLGVSLRYA